MPSVLITGMTSPQCSKRLIDKSKSFAGVLSDALSFSGADVTIAEPTLERRKIDLDKFDFVLVGVAPILSLTANHAYGALEIISKLADSGQLILYIDAPEPGKIRHSLQAVNRNFGSVLKPFYASRKGYKTVESNMKMQKRLKNTVNLLLEEWKIKTLYPGTPFTTNSDVERRLFGDDRGIIRPINVDALYFDQGLIIHSGARNRSFVMENEKTKWSTSVRKTTNMPCVPMKVHKGETDSDVFARVSLASGSLIGPSDDGLIWWSHRLTQSLNAMTPIITDWRAGQKIGQSWSHIAPALEEMTSIDIYETVTKQKIEYMEAILSKQDAVQALTREIGIER